MRAMQVMMLVVLGLAGVLAGGCGLSSVQRAAVARYGAAAEELGVIAAAEFRQSRLDVLAMNRARLGLGDRTVDVGRLEGPFAAEDVAARVEACSALEEYGAVLSRLALGADAMRVGEAAERLVGSLSRLRDSRRIDISDERLGTIGRLVAGVGGVWVAAERARVIGAVMEASGPAVKEVARLIAEDFDPDGERWSLGYVVVATRLSERAANVRAELEEGGAQVWSTRIGAEAALAEAVSMSGENLARVGAVGSRISAAALSLEAAEERVRGALAGSPAGLEDVDPLADKVAELIRVYRTVRR